jgi:ferredoxin-thioredoxin reductase catalytic subunit
VCEKCTADAAAIERLVQAAEAIHDHNGECPCVYADDKWNELNAALAAFREVENA